MKSVDINVSDIIAAVACIYFVIAGAYPQVVMILLCMVLGELARIRKALASPQAPGKE